MKIAIDSINRLQLISEKNIHMHIFNVMPGLNERFKKVRMLN